MVRKEVKEVYCAWAKWAESVQKGRTTELESNLNELVNAAAANDSIAIWTDDLDQNPRVILFDGEGDDRRLADQLRSHFVLDMGMDSTDSQAMFEEARHIVGSLHQEPEPWDEQTGLLYKAAIALIRDEKPMTFGLALVFDEGGDGFTMLGFDKMVS